MTPGSLTNALRGIGGEYELTRVVGAVGSAVYIVGAPAFVAWNMAEGREFDITAFCIAYPGGLGAILVAIGGAAGIKDRNVAAAKATEAKTKTDTAAANALNPETPPDIELAPGETATIAAGDKPGV